MLRLLVRTAPLITLIVAAASCRPGGSSELDGTAEGSGAHTESSASMVDDPIDPAALAGSPSPAIDDESRTCRVDDDCRVVQPGDWSAAVECCYDYPCKLDYEAVNTRWFERQRAWQLANPFDCTVELAEQPCPTRTPRCGLSQDPPPVACDEGTCRIAWPEPWPVVDPEAQTCTVDDECITYAQSRTSIAGRCCNNACIGEPVAVNRRTAEALATWTETHAPACDDVLPDGDGCDVQDCDPWEPPAAHCNAGLCALEDAR
jgi:hypothetical protein